ncbi:hypothetical protein PkP19E3_11970 [Pseudomonas koreensis]|nr:hypothetical protein PkP19E3_11970 [Pseudomonas koreensis]
MHNETDETTLMMPGDIFLMCGEGSEWLATLQKFIYKKAKSSHVMVSMGDGAFVHATPDGGVHFTAYPSINKSVKDGWRVIRKAGLTQEDFEQLQRATMFYAGQAYNYKFFLTGDDASSFCSELTAKIYSLANIELIPEREPSKTTPAHLDEIADGNEWEDVTNTYINGFASIDTTPETYAIGHSCFFALIRKRQIMLKMTDQLFDMLDHFKGGDDDIARLREKFISMESDFRKNKNISFWDERKYPTKEGNAES